MKNLIIFLALSLSTFGLYAQEAQIEVLYFKAQLGCCQARACNALEREVREVVERNFDSQDVVFRQILIANQANAALVAKHNARSQTVVLVSNKDEGNVINVSNIVRRFATNNNKEQLEEQLVARINELKNIN